MDLSKTKVQFQTTTKNIIDYIIRKRVPRVFISSRINELKAERKALVELISGELRWEVFCSNTGREESTCFHITGKRS